MATSFSLISSKFCNFTSLISPKKGVKMHMQKGMMPMMEMYFHFREAEFLLFQGWLPKTLAAYLSSLLAVFFISAFYEALRVGRALLLRMEEKGDQCCTESAAQSLQRQQDCDCPSPQLLYQAQSTVSASSLLSGWHLLQALLHFLQFFLGFVLMLLAMTYNVPVFLALLFGHIAGYFFCSALYQNGLAEEGRLGGDCCCS